MSITDHTSAIFRREPVEHILGKDDPPAIHRETEKHALRPAVEAEPARDIRRLADQKFDIEPEVGDLLEIALQHGAIADKPERLAVVARVVRHEFTEIVPVLPVEAGDIGPVAVGEGGFGHRASSLRLGRPGPRRGGRRSASRATKRFARAFLHLRVTKARRGLSISDEEAVEREERALADHARLPVRTVYQIVRQEGQEQMERPAVSLWWSGFAGGLSISFSLLGQAALMRALPDAPWAPLVSSFGYSIGFLMVILARQQLFTETTITLVLPLLADFSRKNLVAMARMWGLVLAANFAGTLLAALFCSFTPVLEDNLKQAMLEVSMHTLGHGWFEMLVRGISAGFLIAVLVWLMPSAEGAEFQMIVVLTYLIAVGGFQHIVAGSMEAFMLVLAGQQSVAQMLLGFIAPVLIGNILGGTALFGVLSYAQVMNEI